jgi:ornithine cyclodeaminase/alanine dehydrogenase-like protein (mu-crystallin family)
MTFTLLTESNIEQVLDTLDSAQLTEFIDALEHALAEYSRRDGVSYQSERAAVTRPGGQVSLFMPATTEDMIGVKIVGVRPSDRPAPLKAGQKPEPGLKSVLTLCDAHGQAIGVLNAAGLTAFRTSLGSMLLFRFRKTVENIVVFGAGKQALWHIRLAVLLRGRDIRKISIVNRSPARTEDLLGELKSEHVTLPSHITVGAFDEGTDRNAALEALVLESDAIFCTTPSTQPLFPSSFLTSEESQKKSRYIAAIGSYRLDMQEIDPQLLQALTSASSTLPFPSYKGGVISVDSIEGCLKEAGELVTAGIPVERMLEAGALLQEKATSDSRELSAWLQEGFVIYKSVGVGVMDLAIGQHLLGLAASRDIGLRVDDF